MGINKSGNSESVISTEIKSLHYCPELMAKSSNKSITRHFVNLHLILPYTDLVLLNFIVFISDSANVIKYDTKLLNQFSKAAERGIELYSADHKIGYNTSHPNTRKSFINLIEKGILVPMKLKGTYMICPSLVYNSNHRLFNGKELLSRYQEVYSSLNPSEALKCLCEEIKSKVDNELKRTNKLLIKKNAKSNINKRK